jgi:hypothetical protein
MNKVNQLVCLTLGLIAAAGCKSNDGIVGSWKGTQPGLINVNRPITSNVTFNSDGSYSMKSGEGQFSSEIDGTYVYDAQARTISLSPKGMMIGGKAVKATGGLFGQPGQPSPVTWKNSGEIEIKLPMSDLELKRN